MLNVKKIFSKGLTKVLTPTLASTNWDSGNVRIVTIFGLAFVLLTNLRRTSGTGGYIKVTDVPAGMTLSFIFSITPYQSGNTLYLGGITINNGEIQANTGSRAPDYGLYSIAIYQVS